MYRKDWERFQREKCESKTMAKMENKLHYDRIFNGLTDNRSIDILNDESLKNVKKMDIREYIIQYIQESNGKKTPQQIAEAVAIALAIPVTDTAAFRNIFKMVMEELKANPPVLAEVSIAIDGRTVPIIADDFGVRAGDNIFSTDGVPSQVVDEETGELAVAYWSGDNQVPERRGMSSSGFRLTAFANSGDRMTEVPGQFSLPTSLPPPMMPVVFNRSALPDTTELPYQVDPSLMVNNNNAPRALPAPEAHNGLNELFVPRTTYIRTFATEPSVPSSVSLREVATSTGTQTYGDYPSSALEMTPENVRTYSSSKKTGGGRLTQTAQTGPEGMIASRAMLQKYPVGGYSGPERGSRGTDSGVRVMDPLDLANVIRTIPFN